MFSFQAEPDRTLSPDLVPEGGGGVPERGPCIPLVSVNESLFFTIIEIFEPHFFWPFRPVCPRNPDNMAPRIIRAPEPSAAGRWWFQEGVF